MFEPQLPAGAEATSQSDDSLDWEDHVTSPGLASARHVLVVEDEPALRHLMAKVLATEGYFVTEANDGQTMLDILAQSRPSRYCAFDLIVTDVNMPGLTGFDALSYLRQSGCRTPAIVVSALPVESSST